MNATVDALRIAERLCADRRDDEALTRLERGLTDFFQEYMASVRHAHRTKWALRQELDRTRLP